MRDLKNMQVVEGPSSGMRLRVVLLGAIFLALLAVVFGRAVHLQVHQQEKLKAFAEDQYVRAVEIPARRGDIFDRRGTPLAQSVEVDSVWVDPSLLGDRPAAARALGKALGVDRHALQEKLEKGRRFAWVKRQVTPAEAAKVKALELPGVGFLREPRRFYPQRELAAHVLGLVGTDAHGLDGLEKSFEDELSGERVTREGFRDAKGRKLLTNGVEDPQARQGAALTLTIDRQLQYVTEKALEKAVVDAKAVAGTAVVLDPHSGEVLALANVPRFNPNSPKHASEDALRNRAVTDTFEPGSTFKAFVIATALDEKVITESSEFDCEQGRLAIGRHVVHDTHPYGLLKPRGILQVSSNICVAKVAQKLGRERLVAAYERFGFGARAGLGLPGEGKGALPFPKAEIALATQAFGQGLTATALQLAAGYGALGNGGVLMRPYLVSKVVDPDGLVLLENGPTPVRRVVSEKAARQVVSMLESVVEPGGTAPRARLDEYRVAGKTGTAQKADPLAGGYSDKRIASFIGLVPAEAPRAVILVVIDEPVTDVYGGLVAAPAFKEIAQEAMPLLGVPPSRPGVVAAPALRAPPAKPAKSAVVAAIERLEQLDTVTESQVEGAVRVPDLRGKSGRVAVNALMGVALEPQLSGSGLVASQRPAAGTLVDRGTRISLQLAGPLPLGTP
ncbi:MAG: penicillin-binding protein 3 [Myxococcaceae bacterium]